MPRQIQTQRFFLRVESLATRQRARHDDWASRLGFAGITCAERTAEQIGDTARFVSRSLIGAVQRAVEFRE